jgi:colicin import membrane protein
MRPLLGAAGLHLVLIALLAGAALHWTVSQPPAQLAIEGYVADLPKTGQPVAQAPVHQPPPRQEAPPQPPEPVAQPPDHRAEEAAAVERSAREREEQRAREQAEAQRAAEVEAERKAADELARREAAEEEARRKAEADAAAKRKAAEEEARRKAEAEEARRKEEAAAREAKLKAEREAELQRRIAAEEEVAALARSGVMDEYRALLIQTIERNWIRPASARAGLECTLYVTQAPGGSVIDVRLGPCNGDQAVRESITNAVYRASPLPAPRDPRAFERRLEIVFKPTE